MAFKQSLGIEVIVQGGCVGAFQRSYYDLAVTTVKNISTDEKRPVALIFPYDPDREHKEVDVHIYNKGVLDRKFQYRNYEGAWIGTQQQLRQVAKENKK